MITDKEIKKAANNMFGNGKYLTDKEEGFRKGAEWALAQVKNCSIPDVVEQCEHDYDYYRNQYGEEVRFCCKCLKGYF